MDANMDYSTLPHQALPMNNPSSSSSSSYHYPSVNLLPAQDSHSYTVYSPNADPYHGESVGYLATGSGHYGSPRLIPPPQYGEAFPPNYSSAYSGSHHQHYVVSRPSSRQCRPYVHPPQCAIGASQPVPRLTSMQKVQHWNRGQFQQCTRDSGVHSMSQSSVRGMRVQGWLGKHPPKSLKAQSTAPSVMSSIHAASQISTLSSMPSVGAADGGVMGGEALSEQQNALFQNIPANFQQGDREKARRALAELLPLVKDTEEEVVVKALDIVQKIAKFDSDHLYVEPLIRDRAVIDALLHVLRVHRGNKRASRLALCTLFHISSSRRRGLDLIIKTIEERKAKCLDDLVYCIGIHEHSCFKYAFLILHNLMTDREISKSVIHYAREVRIQTQIVGWLGERNEKLLVIIVDILQLLMERSPEQKSLFLSLNGPKHLTRILAEARYENLLARTTKLLKHIANCDPLQVVQANALEVLHIHLDHASQRLVKDVLTCCRDLSDVPAVKQHNVLPLLQKLLQLLGTQDLTTKQLCVQALANLSANNKRNKEFLLANNVIASTFYVLAETEAHLRASHHNPMQHSGTVTAVLEDIQDNSLTILRSMCSGHDRAGEAQSEVSSRLTGGADDILLQKLSQRRVVLLRKSLRVLSAVAAGEKSLLKVFRSANAYVSETVQVFRIAMGHLATSPSFEGVSMHEVVHSSISILQSMCRDRTLLSRVYWELAENPVVLYDGTRLSLPQMALRDEQLALKTLEFMAELARLHEVAHVYAQDSTTTALLSKWAVRGDAQGLLAQRVLQLMESGGETSLAEIAQAEGEEENEMGKIIEGVMDMQPASAASLSADVTAGTAADSPLSSHQQLQLAGGPGEADYSTYHAQPQSYYWSAYHPIAPDIHHCAANGPQPGNSGEALNYSHYGGQLPPVSGQMDRDTMGGGLPMMGLCNGGEEDPRLAYPPAVHSVPDSIIIDPSQLQDPTSTSTSTSLPTTGSAYPPCALLDVKTAEGDGGMEEMASADLDEFSFIDVFCPPVAMATVEGKKDETSAMEQEQSNNWSPQQQQLMQYPPPQQP